MNLLNRFSIATKVWILVGVILGMVGLTVIGSVMLVGKVQNIGLESVEDVMMQGHEGKLQALVQAQTADMEVVFAGLDTEEERIAALRERFANSWFKMTRDEEKKTGYYFAYNLEGVNVAHGAKPDKHGEPYWDTQDPTGKYTYREFSEKAKAGGGFVTYMISKPGTDEQLPKLSYVQLIPGTDIYIGTGVYIDDVQAKLAEVGGTIAGETRSQAMVAAFVLVGYGVLIVVPATLFLTRRAIVGPIREAAEVMRDIAEGEGDLTKRLEVKTQDEVGQLAMRFNAFAQKVNNLVNEVIAATHDVASAATEIAASSEEMARGIEHQREEILQVSAAVEEMSVSVQEVAGKSSDAAGNAEQSGAVAEDGQRVVVETVETMSEIRESVGRSAKIVDELGRRGEEIGEVIAVINDIADQTNLLALNAAIEAARAGEHGRGFAVVADEVRKLADRTTEATAQVGETIRAIQTETKHAVEGMRAGCERVEQGVTRARGAGESLDQIMGRTREVAAMITSIAAAAEQQSIAGQQISRGVTSISTTTTEAAAGASEAAQASQLLSEKAEQLRELVGQFKVA